MCSQVDVLDTALNRHVPDDRPDNMQPANPSFNESGDTHEKHLLTLTRVTNQRLHHTMDQHCAWLRVHIIVLVFCFALPVLVCAGLCVYVEFTLPALVRS
eukprot:3762818-Amphidinium_carterae.1